MPGRLRPPAAVTVGVLSIVSLGAAAGMLYARRAPRVPHAVSFPRDPASCAVVRADRWSPLPGVEYTGRLEVELPAAAASMVLLVSDPLALDLGAISSLGFPVPFRQERLRAGPGAAIPPDLWLERGNPWELPARVIKATFEASPVAARRFTVQLGRRAPQVLARLFDYPDAARASICAAPPGAAAAFADGDAWAIAPAVEDAFGAGWYGVDAGSFGAVARWMSAHGAILVPSARDGAVRVRLHAAPPMPVDPGDPPMLSLVVNEVFEAAPLAMREGIAVYEWTIPDRAWLAHTNELLFSVSPTTWTPGPGAHAWREVGLAMQKLELELVETRR